MKRDDRHPKGEPLTLAITDLTEEGAGVGHTADGFAFFVKDAFPGDIVEATVMKTKSRYGYAHLDRIVTASPDRIPAACPHARACGGCQLQALSYPAELTWKEQRVRNALSRIGKLPEESLDKTLLPICGAASEHIYRYRNKAQLPIAPGRDGKPVAGFYAARTHSVVPVTDCLLGEESFAQIQRLVLAHVEKFQIPAYDERTGE